MFSGCTRLTDSNAINDWNIQKTASFTQMFKKTPTHPEFTKIQGTWNNGTFTPTE